MIAMWDTHSRSRERVSRAYGRVRVEAWRGWSGERQQRAEEHRGCGPKFDQPSRNEDKAGSLPKRVVGTKTGIAGSLTRDTVRRQETRSSTAAGRKEPKRSFPLRYT
jgi:hypothetical protein